MKKSQKWIALLLCVSMLLSVSALAEDAAPAEVTEAVPVAVTQLNADDVLATVNGEAITWADVETSYNSYLQTYQQQYGDSFDATLQENVDYLRSMAMMNGIYLELLIQKGAEMGFSPLSEEEVAAANAAADSDWNSALESYVSYYHSDLTEESPEADRTAANEEAVKYYTDLGYSPEKLHEDYQLQAVLDKVEAYATQDAAVTDEEVEAAYQELVAADKALYENDINAYIEYNNYVDQMAYYSAMYGSASEMDYAWYKPAGFRAVKHILLPVDAELMATYTDLQARYEEQQEASEAGEEAATVEPTVEAAADATEPTVEPTATPVPVTEEEVNAAKAAILESLAATIEEINDKVAEGVDFDELIATYAVKEDGTPTDGGMASEPYKTSGYEVAQGSTNYVAPFVEASFSVDNIGDVSAPYISDYGVHIVKYIADVPAGPVAMTDAQRLAKQESLLTTKKNDLYSAALDSWFAAATIEYSGLVPTMEQLQAAQAAEAEETEVMPEDEAEAQMTEDTEPAPETTAEPAA